MTVVEVYILSGRGV